MDKTSAILIFIKTFRARNVLSGTSVSVPRDTQRPMVLGKTQKSRKLPASPETGLLQGRLRRAGYSVSELAGTIAYCLRSSIITGSHPFNKERSIYHLDRYGIHHMWRRTSVGHYFGILSRRALAKALFILKSSGVRPRKFADNAKSKQVEVPPHPPEPTHGLSQVRLSLVPREHEKCAYRIFASRAKTGDPIWECPENVHSDYCGYCLKHCDIITKAIGPQKTVWLIPCGYFMKPMGPGRKSYPHGGGPVPRIGRVLGLPQCRAFARVGGPRQLCTESKHNGHCAYCDDCCYLLTESCRRRDTDPVPGPSTSRTQRNVLSVPRAERREGIPSPAENWGRIGNRLSSAQMAPCRLPEVVYTG